jgi:hypothetical protein
MENYRYSKHCLICGKFVNKDHVCLEDPTILRRCYKCNGYFPLTEFCKDKTKKYGVMGICKRCRKPFYVKRNNKVKEKRKDYRLWKWFFKNKKDLNNKN